MYLKRVFFCCFLLFTMLSISVLFSQTSSLENNLTPVEKSKNVEQTVFNHNNNSVSAREFRKEMQRRDDLSLTNSGSSTSLHPPLKGETDALGDILQTIDLAAIGMPGDGYDNAGLSWDGTYLYLVNMYDNRVYVIDPAGPSIVTSWPAEPTLSWGLGHDNTELWMTEYYSLACYEYTFAGVSTGNSFPCLAGGASWMGDASEWYNPNYIWLVAVGGTNKIYKFTIPGGVLVDSLSDPAWTSISQRGLTYDPITGTFWIGGWNDNMVWQIDTITGAPIKSFAFTDIASLAFDNQSAGGPYLWLATNAVSNYIYKIDPDIHIYNKDAEVVSIDYPNIDCFVMAPAVPVTVQATIRNNGLSSETFDVLCEVDSSFTIIYSDLESVTLSPGASTQVNFSPQWNAPVEDVNYYVTVTTQLVGDENPANDSKTTRAKAVTWTDEILYDDGTMANAWRWLEPYSYDSIIAKKCEPPYYPAIIKYAAVYLLSDTDPFWPWPDATHDPVELTIWLDTDGDDIPDNLAFRDTVCGDAIAPSWVYVVPKDTIMITSYNFWVGFNNLPGGGEEGIGLDATTNYAANKYTGSYGSVWHTQDTYAGDEMIRAYITLGSLEHDVGVVSIDAPTGYVVTPGVAMNPQATVKNFGNNIESFIVNCFIDSCGANVYTDSKPVNNLNPGSSIPISFSAWTPNANNGVTYTISFITSLVGDQIPSNDTMLTTVVTGQVPPRNYLLIQNYWSWYPITGWASIDSVCQKNGIPLTVYPDDSIGVCDLTGFTKVILPSDQDQAFYDKVQANINWFKSYVQTGGILQVDAADHGSGYGGQWDPLKPLPCDYEYTFVTNDDAKIVMPCHEIILIPNKIVSSELGTWNYVTHGYMSKVTPPQVDTVITNQVSPIGSPCLTVDDWYAGKNRSGGVVIYTTMTLEWAWAYGYSRVLENVILYPNWEPINVGVELTGFTASMKDEGILLKWITASEVDNAAWLIQRKIVDGEWKNITNVPSAGNSPTGSEYTFTDKDTDFNTVYHYRLGSVDKNGKIEWLSTILVNPHTLGLPTTFSLKQNIPNPFIDRTTVKYQVPHETEVRIDIYDVSGRHIKKLVNDTYKPGYYQVIWDGTDLNNRKTATGFYFCRMSADNYTKTRRIIRF